MMIYRVIGRMLSRGSQERIFDSNEEDVDVSVTHLTLDELNSLVIERDTGDMLWYYLIDHYFVQSIFVY